MTASALQGKELAFAIASRRFFRGAEWIAKLSLASPLRARLSRIWGRVASPYVADRADLEQAFALARGASPHDARVMASQWLSSHGLFGTSIFDYRRMSPAWVQRVVRIDRPEVMDALRARGGLVLTYHSHHHNTLGIVLGQSGVPTWGVAATEKGSPYAPYTGRFVRIINGDSEAKFGGGRYLFTDEPRALLRGVREAFVARHAVVSLCDNPVPGSKHGPVRFRGRQFHVGTGVIEMALEQGAPITLALLHSDLRGGYSLRLQALPQGLQAQQVAQAYFDFLSGLVEQAPWGWQGFAWYVHLPNLPHHQQHQPQASD